MRKSMFRNRSTRALASLLVTFSLTITTLAGSASAAPAPKPTPTVTPVPAEIAPGNAGAFDVSFKNAGSSNYSQFFLDAHTPAGLTFQGLVDGPTLISPTNVKTNLPASSCVNTLGDLDCAFGPLNAGYTIYVRPLYDTEDDASGSYPVTFVFTSTGTPADQPGRSHGDDFKNTGSITINTDDDFDGGYFLGATPIATNPALSRRNQQSTSIPAFAAFNGGPLTAEEVALSTFDCPSEVAADGGNCFTLWSIISVDDPNTSYTGGFEVIIGLDSTLASGQVNAIKFVHVKDDGTVELVKNLCNVTTGAAPTNMPCRYFTSDGGDTLAHIWLTQNGRLSGY
jgi:hypothetical protein